MPVHGERTQHGRPSLVGRTPQPDAREGEAGLAEESDRLVVPTRSGNADGGKGPDFGSVLEAVKNPESGHVAYNLLQGFGGRRRN
jgi:hypothetical protein